jgi:serine/threonine-protein kinase
MPDVGSLDGQPTLPESESAVGVDIGAVIAGKYRVERVIGRGGMGVVVAASQLALDRMVAIKLIRPEFAGDPMAVERLLREARAAASIQSEHVARVLDVGMLESGVPFIVMEYLEGDDLQTLIERDGPLPVADAVDVMLEACEAIAEAHRNGIVHRDIKPANVFLARLPGGRSSAKVVDFGISKVVGVLAIEPLTQPSNVVGSLYHMAPEQMRGEAVDARTDLWALGLLLFEMITGTKPFYQQAWPAVLAAVLYEPLPMLAAPVPGLSEELRAIIQKCLRRLPEDRYGTVAEFAVSLSRFGTRRAHASLERIVLLATSTGSLSAHELPSVAIGSEATLAAGGTANRPRSAPPHRLDEGRLEEAARTPGEATPHGSTPLPVSSSPRLPAVTTSRKLSFGVAGALLVVVPALLWLWSRAPTPKGEPAVATPPLVHAAGAAPSEPAPAEAWPRQAATSEPPTVPERLPSATIRVLTPGGGGVATGGPTVAPVAPIAEVPGDRTARRSPAKPAPVESSRGAAPSTASANAPDPSASATGGTEPVAPAASPDERATPPDVGGVPPRSPTRRKTASPWELDDIGFEGKAKR